MLYAVLNTLKYMLGGSSVGTYSLLDCVWSKPMVLTGRIWLFPWRMLSLHFSPWAAGNTERAGEAHEQHCLSALPWVAGPMCHLLAKNHVW